jgi:glycosyltransferase involved in cell wall biosynthesis
MSLNFMNRIAINTRFLLSDKMEGFGWYTFEVVRRLVAMHPDVQFYFFFDRPYDNKFIFGPNVTPVVLKPQARHPILFKLWFDVSVKRALKKYQIDLFFSPDGYISLTTDVPQVAVIHDLNFVHYPQDIPRKHRGYLLRNFPKFARKAAHIITVSNYSKDDLIMTYGISPEKITVGHNGAAELFHPVSSERQETVRNKYASGSPYFLSVGALHPRKNIVRLLQAFDAFKAQSGSQTQLVLVGDSYYWSPEMKTTLDTMRFKDAVRFTGHVQAEELAELYGAAQALVFVSYFEGFGIPLVEAMRCGCPVIAGNRTSLPEVVGDAGKLVDPFQVNEITGAMLELDANPELRASYIQRGYAQAEKFTWDRTAEVVNRVVLR